MTEIMPSLQNLIKLSYDAPAFAGALFVNPPILFCVPVAKREGLI